jgi:PTH1 family peptidyl-tRNA hydrolase
MKKFLIAGLGNIGIEYKNTRHNIGFEVLDVFAAKKSLNFEVQKLGEIAKFKFKGCIFILLKPSTFMNLSGKAVNYWMTKENISIQHLLVITDDLNLPFGSIRLKAKGSDGGHNGLKDIQETLQTKEYARCRFGVDSNFTKGKQSDYVLGKWSEQERETLASSIEKVTELMVTFGTTGIEKTMNLFNGK